jgi:nitrogen fixation protein NifU and related proteins
MKSPYTKELMKHFQQPKFVKEVSNPDGVGEVGNMKCGDIMRLEIKVDEKRQEIKDIGFQTFGCPAAVASSDVVCELAKGRTLDKAMKISKDDIVKALGGMPPIKLHCSILGISALNKAIKDYLDKNKEKMKGGNKK